VRLASFFAASLLAGCGPLVEGELAVQQFCRDVQTQEVPAAPISIHGSWSWKSEWAPPVLAMPDGAQLELALESVEILPGGGIEDLDFLDAAAVQIARLDGAHVAEIAWAHPEGGTVRRVSLQPPAELDLAQLATGNSMQVETTLTGTLPTRAWNVTVRACYQASARYAWEPL
jgi:hypothetical protein